MHDIEALLERTAVEDTGVVDLDDIHARMSKRRDVRMTSVAVAAVAALVVGANVLPDASTPPPVIGEVPESDAPPPAPAPTVGEHERLDGTVDAEPTTTVLSAGDPDDDAPTSSRGGPTPARDEDNGPAAAVPGETAFAPARQWFWEEGDWEGWFVDEAALTVFTDDRGTDTPADEPLWALTSMDGRAGISGHRPSGRNEGLFSPDVPVPEEATTMYVEVTHRWHSGGEGFAVEVYTESSDDDIHDPTDGHDPTDRWVLVDTLEADGTTTWTTTRLRVDLPTQGPRSRQWFLLDLAPGSGEGCTGTRKDCGITIDQIDVWFE